MSGWSTAFRRRPRGPEHVFVLSGGGSLGAMQVGMLDALLSAGIRPDALVGCSVGALNATFMAIDPSRQRARHLSELWTSLSTSDIFAGSRRQQVMHLLRRDPYLYSPDHLREMVRTWAPIQDLSDTTVPVHVVTTDLRTGSPVWWSAGDPVAVLSASASIPGMFPPVELGGSLHLDGGITSLVPMEYALNLGARHVWVLDVTGDGGGRLRNNMSALDVLLLGFTISLRAQHRAFDVRRWPHSSVHHIAGPADPAATGVRNIRDFTHTKELIAIGRAAAEATLRGMNLKVAAPTSPAPYSPDIPERPLRLHGLPNPIDPATP